MVDEDEWMTVGDDVLREKMIDCIDDEKVRDWWELKEAMHISYPQSLSRAKGIFCELASLYPKLKVDVASKLKYEHSSIPGTDDVIFGADVLQSQSKQDEQQGLVQLVSTECSLTR